MKIVVEIDENEILEDAKKIVAESVAKAMLSGYREGYTYRKVIKEVVRDYIKNDIDNLSERAVKAASVSIANKAFKKELLERLAGEVNV